MPCCGATFDENTVPPWTGRTSGGFETGANHSTAALRATPPTEGILDESSHFRFDGTQ